MNGRCPLHDEHPGAIYGSILVSYSQCSRGALPSMTKLVAQRRKGTPRNGGIAGRKAGRIGLYNHGNGEFGGRLLFGPRCRSLQRDNHVSPEILDALEGHIYGIHMPITLVLLPGAWVKTVGGLLEFALLNCLHSKQLAGKSHWLEQLKGFSRVLGFGIAVMLLALFPHRSLARVALAAPPATVTGADPVRRDKHILKNNSEQNETEAARTLTEEDREKLAKEAREKAKEREWRIITNLQLDKRLKELETYLAEENLTPQKRPEVDNKLHELRVFAYETIRQYRGYVIKEMQLTLKKLRQQQEDLDKESANAAKECAALRTQLEKVAGEERTAKENELKNINERMQALWERKVELAADGLAADLKTYRTAYSDLPSVTDRINAELTSFKAMWDKKLEARCLSVLLTVYKC